MRAIFDKPIASCTRNPVGAYATVSFHLTAIKRRNEQYHILLTFLWIHMTRFEGRASKERIRVCVRFRSEGLATFSIVCHKLLIFSAILSIAWLSTLRLNATQLHTFFFYCFSLIYGVALILSCARENREIEPLGRVANLITIITLIEGEQTNNHFFFFSQSCNIEAWWSSNGEKKKKQNYFLNLLWTASPWSSG